MEMELYCSECNSVLTIVKMQDSQEKEGRADVFIKPCEECKRRKTEKAVKV